METRYGAPIGGGEKEVLLGFLAHYQDQLLKICDGLPEADLRRKMVSSGTSLLGLVKHLAYVHYGWFQEVIAGEKYEFPWDLDAYPEWDMAATEEETAEEIFDLYRASTANALRILEDADLDATTHARELEYNVRWVAMHMIEELARHVGHADILREQIDGRTSFGYSWD